MSKFQFLILQIVMEQCLQYHTPLFPLIEEDGTLCIRLWEGASGASGGSLSSREITYNGDASVWVASDDTLQATFWSNTQPDWVQGLELHIRREVEKSAALDAKLDSCIGSGLPKRTRNCDMCLVQR